MSEEEETIDPETGEPVDTPVDPVTGHQLLTQEDLDDYNEGVH